MGSNCQLTKGRLIERLTPGLQGNLDGDKAKARRLPQGTTK
jgi:hypothetical protein